MIIQAGDTALPHMFLRGFRAPSGGAVYDGVADIVSGEEVGTFVAKARMNAAGQPLDPGEVDPVDKPYAGADPSGPFAFEAEIALSKPRPDIVVVHSADAAGLVLDGQLFGTVNIDRGAGFGVAEPRNFGWTPRDPRPGRGDDAGIEGVTGVERHLTSFNGERYTLPEGYRNSFWNGTPPPVSPTLSGPQLSPGHRVRFADTMGPVTEIVIPPGPVLAVTQGGAPLDPPLALTPLVDTVVMVRSPLSFLLLWRASFPWDARYESATLEVS